MSDNVLDRIAASVRLRLDERKRAEPQTALLRRCESARKPHDFAEALRGPGTAGARVIAEIKPASPSGGLLNARPVLEIASEYLSHGAAALSILTEVDHFHGSLDNLRAIRAAYPEARLLMKDFMLEPYQLLEARDAGADCVLLIAALLGMRDTRMMLERCHELGLSALVEVHDEAELAIAESCGAGIIGVNNRDLKTLKVLLDTSFRLARLRKTPDALWVSESGIGTPDEVRLLSAAGFSAFLVGTTLLRSERPGLALSNLIGGAPR